MADVEGDVNETEVGGMNWALNFLHTEVKDLRDEIRDLRREMNGRFSRVIGVIIAVAGLQMALTTALLKL